MTGPTTVHATVLVTRKTGVMRVMVMLACSGMLATSAQARDDIDERPMSQRPRRGWSPPANIPSWWNHDVFVPYTVNEHRRLIAHCIRATAKDRSPLCQKALREGGLA